MGGGGDSDQEKKEDFISVPSLSMLFAPRGQISSPSLPLRANGCVFFSEEDPYGVITEGEGGGDTSPDRCAGAKREM